MSITQRSLTTQDKLLVAIAILAIPTFAWALAGSSFEGADGDLVTAAGTDWQSFVGDPRLAIGLDTPSGQSDDALSGKEDDVAPGIDYGSIPNNKSDLLRFYAKHERMPVAAGGHDFLYLAWTRADTNGSANMDFEFNQSSVLTSNGVTVQRTPGDILVLYGFSGGTSVTLGLSRWTATGPCEASPSGPCWGPVMALNGIAVGAVNSTAPVYDPIGGVTLPALTFGEAAIDLTASGVFDADACVSFGRGYMKSRSSNSFGSSLKDFIRPVDVRVTNCGSITIRKNAVPDSAQDFSFTSSPNLGVASFDLDDDGSNTNALPNARTFMNRFDGLVSITEAPTPDWDLTGISCSAGGTPVTAADGSLTGEVSVDAAAGDTVTCTYTNTQRGGIRVFETVVPGGDPQVFDFELSGGPQLLAASFSMTGASPAFDAGAVLPGTYSIVQTDPGLAWDLQSATCDDGSPVTAVAVSPGEVVTCHFTNIKRGEVIVDEVTVPAGHAQAFPFSLTGGPDATTQSFSLADADTPHASGLVRYGTYAVLQTPTPAGWDLTSATCDDGSAPSAVNLAAGETVHCTFTHTLRGTIVIDEVTVPSGDPQAFSFSLTGGPSSLNDAFSLTDAAAPRSSAALRPGSYVAAQSSAGPAWDLTSAVCDDGSAIGNVQLAAGETVTCTFTNTKRGRIHVDVTTTPSGDPQTFGFSLTGGPNAMSATYTLADASAPSDSGLSRTGTYALAAGSTPSGWDLASVSCSDGSAPAAIALGPGEDLTCTYAYVKRGAIIVDVTTLPAADAQSFGFSVTGGPDAISQSFSLTDTAAPHNSGSVRSGAYVVSPAATPADWDLVSSSCSDGSLPGAVSLAPAETVTCTFAYTKRGRIVVDEVTVPSGDAQSFSFSLTGGPDAVADAFSLTDAAAPRASAALRPGTFAVAQNPAGSGWDLTSAVCSDGSAVGAVGISPGETVTCTFTNTKRGRIHVDVVTTPSADPQTFGFVLSGGPDALNASFALADASTPFDSGSSRAGTYAVAASATPAGWDLTSSSCSDASSPAAIGLAAGEDVTCTFVYVKRGRVRVDVTTSPAADPQSFGFAFSGGPDALSQSFSLTDVATPYDSGLARPGTYAVAANPTPAGWDLASVSCSDGSGPASIGLSAGEIVTCTYAYVKRGNVRVDVVTLPSADPQSFGFSFTGGPDAVSQSFSLTDAATPYDSGAVRPGTYAATAAATPADWDLTSASCSDGSAPGSVSLQPAETVTCTFTYTKRGRIIVDEVTVPAGDPQAFSFTLTGGPNSLNDAFSLTDAAAPRSSAAARPGTYAAAQGPAAGWDLTSAVCSDGSPVGGIQLAPGEIVTCTFTNTKRGKILVDEVTDPSGDPQSFSFTLTGGPDAISQPFSLTDTSAKYDSGNVRAGTFAIAQGAIPADWVFDGATCSDGSPIAAVAVSAGETVTCTFHHAKLGRIVIVKDARPDSPPDFGFSLAGPSGVQTFLLDDDGNTTDNPATGLLPRSRSFTVPKGSYIAAEDAPTGMWELTAVTCTSSQSQPGFAIDVTARTASIGLRAGEVVTCTFVNVVKGRIIVIKMLDDTTPGAIVDPTQIPFDFTSGWGVNFFLKHTERYTSPWLLADRSYAVTETEGSPWQASSDCVFPDGHHVTGGASISVTPPPAGDVICTFINSLSGAMHAGSSGFWKNWRNHYTDAQFRMILAEAVAGSPVYRTLFDASGNLRSDAISLVDAIYSSAGGSDAQTLLKEMTSTRLNLAVSTSANPAIRALQENDDIAWHAKLILSASTEALIRSLAPCDIPAGVRISDLIDVAEAAWNGDLSTGTYRFDALGGNRGTIAGEFEQIGQGANLAIGPDSVLGPIVVLDIGGPTTYTWNTDADGDGHGVPAGRAQTCSNAAPIGFAASTDDCDDAHAAVYPGAPEVCDGFRNDCRAAGWPSLGGLESDDDHDGVAECGGDCNDANAAMHPGLTDSCNGIDDDCDGLVDGGDSDGDGIKNVCDNCKLAANPTQADGDHDGFGDPCDVCAAVFNPDQLDGDHDGIGDLCDNCKTAVNSYQDDLDLDGIGDLCDNCPENANAAQSDFDHDGEGDLCDLNDGLIYITPLAGHTYGIEWQREAGFDHWNVYRGSVQRLRTFKNYTQAPGSNPMAAKLCALTDNYYVDLQTFSSGALAFYLVTGTSGGVENSLGVDAYGVQRVNTLPCP